MNPDKEKSQINYVPLSEAARSLYADLREYDNQHAQIINAESLSNEPDGVLIYFAAIISAHTEVFGKRPPSTKLEKLAQEETNRGRFINSGDGFVYHGKDKPAYIDMAVHSNSLPRILNSLKLQERLC